MDPRGRTALVTGGAVRVGRAISLALARAGMRVIVHHNASADAAESLVDTIRREGGLATALAADLRSLDSVSDLAEAAEAIAPIDLLVNNASIFPPERFDAVTGELWEATMAINLRAPFFLTQRLGGAMKLRGRGVVINLADLSGLHAWSGHAAHAISKAGLIHLTRVAARALAPQVRVAAIAPGTVLPPDGTSPTEVERLAARAPLQRIGSPEDVAEAVLYLLSADFLTGQILVVDGGRNLAG